MHIGVIVDNSFVSSRKSPCTYGYFTSVLARCMALFNVPSACAVSTYTSLKQQSLPAHIASHMSFSWVVHMAEELCALPLCLGCGAPHTFCCEQCFYALPWIQAAFACRVCGAPFGWLCCGVHGEAWERAAVYGQGASWSVLEYASFAKRFITTYKDARDTRLAPYIAALMAVYFEAYIAHPPPGATGVPDVSDVSEVPCASQELSQQDVPASTLAAAKVRAANSPGFDGVCFVPATKAAYTYRGFDHMELVARLFADVITIPYIDALARPYAADQRALNKQQRMSNLAHSMLVVQPESIQQKHMLVLDDTLTTGASVIEAARALHEAGAASVCSFTLTRVW